MPKVLDWQQDWPHIALDCKHGNMDGLRECLAKNDELRAEPEALSPEALRDRRVEGAKRHLQDILAGAISSIPSCPGEGELAQLVKMQATRMLEINDSKIIV